ncbi:MAG: two-component sensor histidine kinase [Candidatus Latescibacterota bacterium]|jgi:two-component sensor histidine kinase
MSITTEDVPRGRKMGLAPDNRFRIWLGDLRIRIASQRQFSAYFFLSAVVVILVFLLYAHFWVVRPMRSEANRMGKLYAFMHSIATLDNIDISKGGFYQETVFETVQYPNFPVVITDAKGEPRYWKAIGVEWENPTPEVVKKVNVIVKDLDLETPAIPFEFPGVEWGPDNKPVAKEPEIWYLHYGESDLVKRLSWLPYVALGVTALFVSVGYIGFRQIKNNEQRSIWVGMARETAHQLGTPLSSLYGWMELFNAEVEEVQDEGVRQKFEKILAEMAHDTNRLTKITSRFSLIGSTPELRPQNVRDAVADTVAYLRVRLPRGVEIIEAIGEVPVVPLNRELLGWAFENLFKNAADAMEGKAGRIDVSSEIDEENRRVDIMVSDNGKGIPPHLAKQVFFPGYSTKKRGWGLGLAFVKRIIEDYHQGRVYIKDSTPGEGTIFVVSLPYEVPSS